jgi:DNA replication protein DnaC
LIEKGENVRIYDETFLFNEIRKCWEMPGESQENRIDIVTDADYFILDDLGSTGAFRDKFTGLHCLGMPDKEKTIIEALIDLRLQKELPFLITTNFSEKDMTAFFAPRIISRLYAAENTVVEINIPDRRKGF